MSTIEKKADIRMQLRDFIVENYLFGSEESMVGSNESFMENGIIDSLGILELIEFCEETYGISIEDNELVPENLDSLDNLDSFIKRKK